MSICIAAIAEKKSHDPKLVICTDRKIELQDFASAETAFKVKSINPYWLAMLAGDMVKAKELSSAYETIDFENTKESDIFDQLQRQNEAVKKSRVERHLRMKCSMSFEEFITKGQQAIPPDLYQATWREIEALNLGCELVIAGFSGRRALLFSYEDASGLQECDSFAAVGSGSWIAKAALYQRSCHEDLALEEVLYYVYEAKRLSEIAPGVGRKLNLGVLAWTPTGTYKRSVNTASSLRTNLAECYRKFGLKKFVSGSFSAHVKSR